MKHTQWCMDSPSEGCADPSCARIAELEAELGDRQIVISHQRDMRHAEHARALRAENRLANVLALVLPTGALITDGTPLTAYDVILLVRAAATGDTK